MKKIEITEKNVKAAFKAAKSDEVKEVLAELFYTPENKLENKPNLDDYTTIKSYEDACEALDLTPIYSDKNAKRAICQHINEHWDFRQALPKHIIALLKLETISRALWGKDFQPKPDAGSTWYYYPWFALYTKKEIEGMTEKNKGALLPATAGNGAHAGFGYLAVYHRSSSAHAYIGFRLCQETEEKATYFGKQFAEIWADYLAFNFITVERIKTNHNGNKKKQKR